MVAIPTMKDEDAKRPNREHDSLIGERSRIVNRMKAALVRLGIRGFNPKLKRASTRLDGLRTPEGEPIPPNALAELRRDMERRRLVNNQIRQIEEERLKRIKFEAILTAGNDWQVRGDLSPSQKHPPDDEQRLHQYRQVGDILDKLLDTGLELHLANHSDLEAEVAQGTSQIVLDR